MYIHVGFCFFPTMQSQVIFLSKYIFCYIQSHDDTNDDHQKMTISDYRIQAKRLERRVCPKHTAYPYSLGCKVCIQLFCVQCVSSGNLCVGGEKVPLKAF